MTPREPRARPSTMLPSSFYQIRLCFQPRLISWAALPPRGFNALCPEQHRLTLAAASSAGKLHATLGRQAHAHLGERRKQGASAETQSSSLLLQASLWLPYTCVHNHTEYSMHYCIRPRLRDDWPVRRSRLNCDSTPTCTRVSPPTLPSCLSYLDSARRFWACRRSILGESKPPSSSELCMSPCHSLAVAAPAQHTVATQRDAATNSFSHPYRKAGSLSKRPSRSLPHSS